MTRFEESRINEQNMSIMVALCIATYLEQSEICTFTNNGIKRFITEISSDIEEWLKEESEE